MDVTKTLATSKRKSNKRNNKISHTIKKNLFLFEITHFYIVYSQYPLIRQAIEFEFSYRF